MLEVLRHRGPDDEGLASSGAATLGARRLAIIDLARGHQPMASEDGRVVAVQNGELYNFREVREALAVRGHRFTTDNDTEVIPHAYEEWGDAFVERLRGMFAIALWDAGRERLVLARDRLGKKPLAYAVTDGGIAFASELQALLTLPIDRAVDDEALRAYLTFGYIDAPRTAFRAIRKVRPGTVVAIARGAVTEQVYWRPTFTPKLALSEDEALERLRTTLTEAVRVRLISDVPLGVFLSGGLDSSTIVALMAQASAGPVRTFAVGFSDESYSELRYARLVAERFGTEHHELVVEPAANDVLPRLVRHLGEPFADSSIVPSFHVAQAARRHVTVALNGDGGDELFAGYDRYRAAALAARLDRVPRPLRAVAARLARALPAGPHAPALLRRARRFALPLADDAGTRYRSWIGYFDERILGERLRRHAPAPALAIGEGVDGLQELDLTSYLPGDLLVKMDIATMAASLEGRSPFLDHEVVDLVNRLPARLKLRGGRSKHLLRRLMAGVLPDEILARRKMGFVMPVAEWVRGPLRPMVTDLLLDGPDRGFVDREEARRVVREHLDGRVDRTRQVWALLMLELWSREVVERPAEVRVLAR